MRIPPSLIIMSLVTATPFGLAIRDTLTKKSSADEGIAWGSLDVNSARDARREREMRVELEAEEARDAAEKTQKRTEATARLGQLFGTKPGTLGALFDGIHLGADSSSFQPDEARERIEQESEKGFLSVSFDTDATMLRGINVSITADGYDESGDAAMCRALHDKLVAAWGPGTNGSWLDETRHQRVHLEEGMGCTLSISRSLQPAEWLAAIPLNLVGKGEALLDAYATKNSIAFEEREDDTGRWFIPAMGTGEGSCEITALIDRHKVVGLRVSGVGDFDSVVAVRDLLTAQLKAQPKPNPDDDSTVTWKHKPPVQLTTLDGDNHFEMLVGKDPTE